MVQYHDLEKAVDYLIDETPEGAPFRDGKVFVRGHFVEKKVDPPQPPNCRGDEVIRIGINSAGKATIWFRPENPGDRDPEFQADLYRLSVWQPRGSWDLRRRYAFPFIVRACADGAWKARGQRPSSAEWEHILNTDFNGSEINEATGDLMATPGPTSTRPESKVAIWTNLMFAVPGGADEGKAADTKGVHVGRRPASQSRTDEIWKAFDELRNALTFNHGELARIAWEIGKEIDYKPNTVEKIIRDKYRELEEEKKQGPA